MAIELCSRTTLIVVCISIVAHLVWSHVDCNISLYVYDAYLSSGCQYSNHWEGRRRLIGSTSSMEGKTVWVTGASSGIGAELSIQLVGAGVSHVILSGRREDKLELVSRSCQQMAQLRRDTFHLKSSSSISRSSLQTTILPFDNASEATELDAIVSRALQAAGPTGIDVLVLNAGQYHCAPALETHLDAVLPHLLQVNFQSAVLLSQRLILADQWHRRPHGGHLVVVSSLMGRGSSPLNAAYSATKHALRGYFHSLAAEEHSWLRVDVACPGATDTGLWEGALVTSAASMADHTQTKQNSITHTMANTIPTLHADDRAKMSVERCAQLIITGMMGPNALFFETWITNHPGLLWVFLASYEPFTFRLLNHIISPLRMGLWRRDGSDPLYLPSLLKYLFGMHP